MNWAPDEEPLLELIRRAPADDRPRHVYADWLLQRGDPYGAFLAASLRGESRAQSLLAPVAERVSGGLSRRVRFDDVRRGFLWNVEYGDLARTPLDCDGWQMVEQLTFKRDPAPLETFVSLIKTGWLASLRRVDGVASAVEALGAHLGRALHSVTVQNVTRPVRLGALRDAQTVVEVTLFQFLTLSCNGPNAAVSLDWTHAAPPPEQLAPVLASFIRPTDTVVLEHVVDAEAQLAQLTLALASVPHAGLRKAAPMMRR